MTQESGCFLIEEIIHDMISSVFGGYHHTRKGNMFSFFFDGNNVKVMLGTNHIRDWDYCQERRVTSKSDTEEKCTRNKNHSKKSKETKTRSYRI